MPKEDVTFHVFLIYTFPSTLCDTIEEEVTAGGAFVEGVEVKEFLSESVLIASLMEVVVRVGMLLMVNMWTLVGEESVEQAGRTVGSENGEDSGAVARESNGFEVETLASTSCSL